MLVYKIVATEEWTEAEAAGVFTGAAVDRADGFIHFSTAEQAPETAAKWFAGRDDLTLAAIDAEALGDALRWEPSRGGALFPHLYGAFADERRRLVAGAQARTRRRPCFREPRAVRLAKVASLALKRLPAETAHRAAINALKIVAARRRRPPCDPRLSVEALGLRFPNPLGLAAGFDKNAEVPGAMLKLGFGFVEVGTLTPRPQAGQRPPAPLPPDEDAAVINRFGFNNDGFERARARLERRPPGVIGVNLGANKDAADRVADYVLGVRTFAPLADYLTLNISSPNTPGLRDLQRREALDDLIGRVVGARDETEPRRPLMLKIAPDLDARGLEDIVAVALTRRDRRPHRLQHHAGAARVARLEEPRRKRGPVGASAVCAIDKAPRPDLSPDRRRDAAHRLRRGRGFRDRAGQDRGGREPGAALYRPRPERAGGGRGDPRGPRPCRRGARPRPDRRAHRDARERLG